MILERIVDTTLQLDSDGSLLKMHKRKPKRGVLNRCVERIMAAPFIPTQPILHRADVHHETQQNIRKQTVSEMGREVKREGEGESERVGN